MNYYLLLKWLHILSSVVLVGTGIGSAYYLFLASRTRNAAVAAVVVGHVVQADWWFTTPTIVFQPVSGFWLVYLAGYSLHSLWLAASLALYALAVASWLPVVGLQIRMRNLARRAVDENAPLPDRYWRDLAWWVSLGVVAFCALVVVFYLMVAKPT
ncbi:MAG TPA: DUF2269 domain-containing protein [Azonexus sp.]|nr:DUF2269 domain-containing protein [Azonexus sp.]